MYPSVSLERLHVDAALVRRLPRHLAYYHLAVPIGIDDEGITVAMSQPDNAKAREIIEKVLGQPIILVQSEAEQILRFLDGIYPLADPVPWQNIITSSEDQVVSHYARRLADIYRSHVLSAPDEHSENTLFIQRFDEEPMLEHFSSTLLVNRVVPRINRVLHLARLHPPDLHVIASLLPLITADSAQVTTLPDTEKVSFNLAHLLDESSPQGQHLEKLKRQLEEAGVSGWLRLRQAKLVEAVRAELACHHYDLVAVAADAYGEFVQTLVAAVKPFDVPAMMIIKPDLR